MQPELLIIADQPPDHPIILSLVSQFLEMGVHFASDNETFPRELPASLDGYKAVLLDAPAYTRLVADPQTRQQLEAFTRAGGYVAAMEDTGAANLESLRMSMGPKLLIDLATSNRAHDTIVHAGLSRFSPAHLSNRLARTDADILASQKAYILRNIQARRKWDEFTLHFWKPAKALADAGHTDVRDALLQGIAESIPNLPSPDHHDLIAGFFAVPWYTEQTGDRAALQRIIDLVDEVIARRPREMGTLCGTGYADDPLGLNDGKIDPVMPGAATRAGVIWTEVLHFHGPTFSSLARITGEKRYLDELMLLVDHIAQYHVRPDGLFAHCTRHGKPVAAAWGRGQTHALYGLRYALEEMSPGSPEFQRIITLLTTVGRALRAYQDPNTGLWRNVIDIPLARLDSTCTTGIAATYALCLRKGWLPRSEFEPMVRKAWQGLKLMYWRGGLCAGCRGTAAGTDPSYYLARPHGWSVVPQLVMPLLDLNQM